jgi:hypothetical protein
MRYVVTTASLTCGNGLLSAGDVFDTDECAEWMPEERVESLLKIGAIAPAEVAEADAVASEEAEQPDTRPDPPVEDAEPASGP